MPAFTIREGHLEKCTLFEGESHVEIPNSVTSIGDSAFYGCIRLTQVTIPDSVTSIDKGAFKCCSWLNALTLSGQDPLPSVKQMFYIWDIDTDDFVAPTEEYDILPLAGLSFKMRILAMALSEYSAKNNTNRRVKSYAKGFCAPLLLIHKRSCLTKTPSNKSNESSEAEGVVTLSSLPYMPPEMWLFIAKFYFRRYGLDELDLGYGVEGGAGPISQYQDHMTKLDALGYENTLHSLKSSQ
ncbi:leucine-rich repeat domain-containing protein [Candidatus Synchoanobacter obligatus]|uniref:leucine-rich repeat domain-containing protein n=1 Tax=Candidatus Synchoanobacter obligatus TaxID=2919597 RepID=UPI0023519887|nr:leucine-rich repeat domain-containing protein [Candidatus Synchoanobacter obligatus]